MSGKVNDFNYYLLKHGHYKEDRKGEIIYTISVNDSNSTKEGIFDDGLLIALIDSFSSFSTKGQYPEGVSINLSLKSFNEMIKGNDYELRTKIIFLSMKYVVLECRIYDKDNTVIKIANHTKRIPKERIIPKAKF